MQPREAWAPPHRAIGVWLLACCALVFAMVMLGGVTRLTGSGLSMVDWDPVMGVVPPLNTEQWQRTFERYKQSPEYRHKNFGMSLSQFKRIFAFEYAHRILGRLIGIAFLVPFLYFLVRKRFTREMVPKLATMFVLGGLQGLLGWYMVKSGLVDRPHVSQYRLTAHLGAALAIYAYMFWVALDLWFPVTRAPVHRPPLRRAAAALTAFVFVTVLSGGFVAGLKAGFAYNTFPLMDGHWIPEAYLMLEPAWLNAFENIAAVQFNHRLLAVLVLTAVIVFWVAGRRHQTRLPGRVNIAFHLLLLVAVVQVTLGISTLLLHVPVSLASLHQGGAVVLFTIALFITHEVRAA
ncbi:MAG: heme A synthase [Gammaproteobacteria bacterium]|nr:heme A synthase [Gammaproteobacteria bacterium]NIR98595.1 heme A synthase [Gammaproteobacteria bacterium]NIT64318.1 heme A synthase [Gammaproteobacteria bacterium]NIV21242.1 heme A synthase [Gammaproteobacteria bacterium]NIX10946.1 heme A synthase [Gammaproteobacteria bacterium]